MLKTNNWAKKIIGRTNNWPEKIIPLKHPSTVKFPMKPLYSQLSIENLLKFVFAVIIVLVLSWTLGKSAVCIPPTFSPF